MAILINKPKGMKVAGYSNQKNVMFTINGKEDQLTVNHRYLVHFKPMHQEAIELAFMTPLSPMLTNVKRIRMDTGGMLNDMSDEEIARHIYENSQEVQHLRGDSDDDDEEIDYDHYMAVWVRYKTDCDLVQAAYITRSVQAGLEEKRIGETSINREVTLPVLEDMIKRFERKMEEAEAILRNVTTPVAAFQKASTNYTYPERGSF